MNHILTNYVELQTKLASRLNSTTENFHLMTQTSTITFFIYSLLFVFTTQMNAQSVAVIKYLDKHNQPIILEDNTTNFLYKDEPSSLIIDIKLGKDDISVKFSKDKLSNSSFSSNHYKILAPDFGSLTVTNAEIIGIVKLENKYYEITKKGNTPFQIERQIQQPSFSCNSDNLPNSPGFEVHATQVLETIENGPPSVSTSSFPTSTALMQESTYELGIDIFIDRSLLEEFNNDKEAVQQAATARFNIVSEIYLQQVNIQLLLNDIIFLEENDGVINGDITGFNNYITSRGIVSPLNHLFYKSEQDVGIVASVGDVCKGGSASTLSNNFFLDNVIFAHELGHLLGARHTHHCIWPGGVIDSCFFWEGDCYTFNEKKRFDDDKQGTIMSYCRQPVLEFHPYVREFIYGFTRWTPCEDFEDNGVSLSGQVNIKFNYLGRPVEEDGSARFLTSSYILDEPDINRDFAITKGGLSIAEIPTFFAVLHLNFGHILYPSFKETINTLSLPNYPEWTLNVEKKYDGIITIATDNFQGFSSQRIINASHATSSVITGVIESTNENNEQEKEVQFENLASRKYCLIPESFDYVYSQFPVVAVKNNLPKVKIDATYQPNAGINIIRFMDAKENPVEGIPLILEKDGVKNRYVSNEVGLIIINNLVAGTYNYEIEEEYYQFSPLISPLVAEFLDEVSGTLKIVSTSNIFGVRFYASKNDAIRNPDQPIQIEPFNQAIVDPSDSILFHWIYTIAAVQHELQIAKDSSFEQIVSQHIINDRLNFYRDLISEPDQYFWRLKGINEKGISDYSETWSFTVGLECASTSTNISASICQDESFILGNQILTIEGDYTEIFQSAVGCDSIVNLSLTILEKPMKTISREICAGETYTLGTQVLTTSGDYTEIFQNAAGCDSIVNLSLFNFMDSPSIQLGVDTIITLGESISFELDANYAEYLWSDGTTGSQLSFLSNEYGVGVHTIDVVVIDQNGCSAMDEITITVEMSTSTYSIEQQELIFMASPNPVKSYQSFSLILSERKMIHNLEIYTIEGKLVYQEKYDITAQSIHPSLSLPTGLYFASLKLDKTKTVWTKIVIQ